MRELWQRWKQSQGLISQSSHPRAPSILLHGLAVEYRFTGCFSFRKENLPSAQYEPSLNELDTSQCQRKLEPESVSTRLQPTALVLITFPFNELSLALYFALVQQLWNMQVYITAGNEGEKLIEELAIAPESESTVLLRRAHIYSEVVWSEQPGFPPRLGASSSQCMKKQPQHCRSFQGKNHVSGLYFFSILEIKQNLSNPFCGTWWVMKQRLLFICTNLNTWS